MFMGDLVRAAVRNHDILFQWLSLFLTLIWIRWNEKQWVVFALRAIANSKPPFYPFVLFAFLFYVFLHRLYLRAQTPSFGINLPGHEHQALFTESFLSMFILGILNFYTSLHPADEVAALETLNSTGMPSFDCEMILKGEPDIVGPGVRKGS
jgi:hypothetical protein